MSEISETEIKSMTKEQNYLRGYADCEKDLSFKNLIVIPENATIGDVIKAVFPDWKIEHVKKMSGLNRYDINIDNFNRFSFYEDFWNSPYQPVKEAERNKTSYVVCTYQKTGCGSCEHQTNCSL